MNNTNFTIFTFYQFKKFTNLEKNKLILKDFCLFHKIRGTILIAEEGINGALAGFKEPINLLKNELKKMGFTSLESKISNYNYMPFSRLKIKIKKEIITFTNSKRFYGEKTAKYIKPKNWNKLINENDTLVLDVRNDFEYNLGTFKHAKNPKTKSFSDFKKYIDDKLFKHKNKKIALFCTGGIRCEKASSYMSKKGFKKLFQLKGGILKYLEEIPKKESNWIGECFVFDKRVSLQNELAKGTFELCHGCRMPISELDRKSEAYNKGISCPKCFDKLSNNKKKRLEERNKQIKISKKRGLYNPYINRTPTDFF